MKKMLALAAAAALPAALAASAGAQTIDGTAAGDAYGLPVAIQDTQTNFGDNSNPDPLMANGSEIDGLFATFDDDNLYLLFSGNLETNFNKLSFFVDSVDGGQNVVDGADNPDVDFGALQALDGLAFDSGFAADYFFSVTGGNDPTEFFANYAVLGGDGMFLGSSGAGNNFIDGENDVDIAFDNSNVAGVMAGTGSADAVAAAAVMTGVEFRIPLAALGNPDGPIQLAAFINGSGNDFLSNQVLGGIGSGDNLGAPSSVDFSQIAGDQFVTLLIPEPATAGLLGVAGLALLRRRR